MANAQQSRPATSNDEVSLEIDDSQTVRQIEESHQPPILVLSRDSGLVETVRKAAPRGSSVAHAPDLDHVADRLPNLKPGVLVADTASTSDVSALVAQLTQHFPELVVVVAGKREENAALMQLTATGRIFRFLLTPLSHGQTRLSLEAAMAQHIDLRNAGNRRDANTAASGGGTGNKNPAITYGALAAGLLVVIGGIWFGVSKFTGETQVPVVTQTTTAGQPGGIAEKPDPVKNEILLAREAFAQGKFVEPAGDSALDYYRSALALDPSSADAKAGVRSVTDQILLQADAALTSEKLEEAVKRIEQARDIESNHPRLSFYDTQIARERERLKLSQAQDVSNKVKSLVQQGTDRMANGRLITPPGQSARDAFVEARRLDPTDPNVAQGIRDLSGLIVEEGRKSVAAGKLDEAQQYVTAARGLGSAGAALSTVERALADAQRAATPATTTASTGTPNSGRRPAGAGPDIAQMATDIRQRISENKLIDPPGESAKDLISQLRTAAPNAREVEELSRALTTKLLDVSKQAAAAKVFDRATALVAGAREVGSKYMEPQIAQAERDLTSLREQNAAQTSIVSAAALKRTKTVEPKYPEVARKRGIEGWVELAFTVTPTGTVEDVEVRNASPQEIFDDAAIRAIKQWKFVPVERNGQVVAQRAMVRLRFEKQNAQ
jgi:TonB family protein